MEPSPFFHPRSHRVTGKATTTPGGTKRLVNDASDKNHAVHTSTLWGTASNLINAIVGCGIVGIPYALRQSGFVCGIVLIVVCAWLTEKSLRLLVATAQHVHVSTYEVLLESCFGAYGFYFVTVNMFLCAYGAMISYLMIVKDSFGTLLLGSTASTALDDADSSVATALSHRWVLAADTVGMRRTILLVISLGIIVPLSCQRDMADLAVTSRWNVGIDTVLVALVAWNAVPAYLARRTVLDDPDETEVLNATTNALDPTQWKFWIRLDTLFIGMGVLSFAFVCQHSAFLIAGSLEQPTVARWSRVTFRALVVCLLLALLCGVTGFLGYQDDTNGNILTNLNPNAISANVARALLGTTMLFVYPLESFVARHVGVVLLFTGRHAHDGDDAFILARTDRRVLLTVALYLCAVIPAALASDLGPILAITGSIGGSCLSYIGPGLAYLGVHGQRFLHLASLSFGPSNADASNHAGEETPLVSSTTTSGTSGPSTPIVVSGLWNHVVWYTTGMPVWCYLATWGQGRLEQHVHEMATKSPHPIRIGNVEYARVEAHDTTLAPTIVRKHSLPHLHTLPATHALTIPNVSSINQQIGQGLLAAQKTAPQEANPPEEPLPAWSDFILAIGYIGLGLVAMFAGLYSIFCAK